MKRRPAMPFRKTQLVWLQGLWLMAATVSAVGPTCLLLFEGDACGIPAFLRLPIAIAAWWAAWRGWNYFAPPDHQSFWRVGGFRSAVTAIPCTVLLIWSCCLVGPRTREAERMVACVRADDVARLQEELQQGADPNGRMPRGPLSPVAGGESPLCIAATLGRDECAKTLLAAGADINAGDVMFTSPLDAAAREGRWGTVRTLIECGARINDPATGGCIALVEAVSEGQEDVVRYLLAHGANPNTSINSSRDPEDRFPIVRVAPAGPIRDALVKAGALY